MHTVAIAHVPMDRVHRTVNYPRNSLT